MRNILFATTALAFAGAVSAGPAAAADMLSIGVGGYMEQWVGFANRDDDKADGGFDIQSDSEIYFQGSLESDSGLKFTVHVELEANNGSHKDPDGGAQNDTEIDESYAWISGAFGRIDIGARDPIHTRMHYAAAGGAGVGLNAGDTQNWIPGAYLETAGWTIEGDDLTVTYITPRTNGVQVGVSYVADSTSENDTTSAPTDNDNAAWAAAINYNETIGDMSIKVSLGHINVSNPGSLSYNMYNNDLSNDNVDAVGDDDMVQGFDDKTFTNAGISIGMGAFTFGASYATRDNGGHESKCYATVAIDAADLVPAGEETPLMKAQDEAAVGATIPCGHRNARFADQNIIGQDGDETLVADNAVNARHMFVEDESGQSDTWAVGIGYTDGPLSLSVGHVSYEQEDGDERTATMVSAGYKLAPGVAWKTSIFGVEDDTKDTEGTAFVTGLRIDF
jgi:hypothetical protein